MRYKVAPAVLTSDHRQSYGFTFCNFIFYSEAISQIIFPSCRQKSKVPREKTETFHSIYSSDAMRLMEMRTKMSQN